MTTDWHHELEAAIWSQMPLQDVVALLRHLKQNGVTREEAYSFLESLRAKAPDEMTDDRILEVADFVAGFCSPHLAVWEAGR